MAKIITQKLTLLLTLALTFSNNVVQAQTAQTLESIWTDGNGFTSRL